MKQIHVRPLAGRLSALALALLAACSSGGSDTDLIASARILLARQDAKGAVIQLKSALQKNPKSAEARFLLGKTLLETGDPVAAIVELTKAQELQAADEDVAPELARAMLLMGEPAKVIAQYGELRFKNPAATADLKTTLAAAFAVQGSSESAGKAVGDALQARPGFAPAVIVQARLAAAEGRLDEALHLLDEVLAREPANERAGVLKGEILWQAKNDRDAAIVAFRQVLAGRPDGVAARAAVGNILLQQRKGAEAKVEVEQLKKVAPNHPETLFLEAQLAFNEGDFKATRAISERVLKAMPENVSMLKLGGAAEYRMKEYLLAEAYFGRALKVAPRDVITRQMLAQTYLRTGQPAKAVEVLQPVTENPRADGASLALTGEAWLQQGDAKRSEEAFQRALKAAPGDARVRTSAAMAQLSKGNLGAAVSELEAVAGGDSGTRADLALISALLRQSDLDGALKAIDALARKAPSEAYVDNLRGRVLGMKNDMPAAGKSFEAALSKDPNYFPAVASLATLDLTQSRPDSARRRFEDFLKANPKSASALLALAEMDARSGAPAAQVNARLKDAAKLNPSEPRPHLILIARLTLAGDDKAALQAAQDAAAALPNNLEIMEALGRAQLAAGDGQRALTTFKKLASLQPKSVQPALRLAEAYSVAKDNEAAARELRRALELQPDLVAARRGLALLAVMNNKPQDAIAIARDVQQRQPKGAGGYALEGEIEAGRKHWDAAATAYRAALQRGKNAEVAIKLHMALAALGKKAEADRLAGEWLKDNPKDAAFRYYLGDASLARNDLQAAETEYRAVLAIQPRHPLALNNVAWLMVRQGKPGAVAMAEQAVALLPDRAPLLDTLSSALEADNQLPLAIQAQQRAIALQPKDSTLTLRLAKLYIKQGNKARARAELETLAAQGDKFAAQAEVGALLKSL